MLDVGLAAGSASNRSWRRPGGPEAHKIHVAPPGGLLGRKVDRFQLPGGGPGAPRSLRESLPESIFEASFLGAPPGTKKVCNWMHFLTCVGGVSGRGGVGFLLASALAGAKAEVEELKESIVFHGVICLCALCARMAQTKGRERTIKRHRSQPKPTTQEKTHAADTPQIIQKTTFWYLPKSIPGPFVSLLAPGFAQDRPQDASKSAPWSLRGAEKNFRRQPGGRASSTKSSDNSFEKKLLIVLAETLNLVHSCNYPPVVHV